jgi:hypothetical protein
LADVASASEIAMIAEMIRFHLVTLSQTVHSYYFRGLCCLLVNVTFLVSSLSQKLNVISIVSALR